MGQPASIRARIEERFGWKLYRVLGLAGGISAAVAILADVSMWLLLEGYDPVRSTISAAAAGPHDWILDGALLTLAVGVGLLTIGFILRGGEGWRSYTARGALIALTIILVPIAFYHGYADGVPGGMKLHKLMTAVIYVAVPLVLWLTPEAPPRGTQLERHLGRGAAVIFLVLGPFFFLVPKAVQGLYERGLALIILGAVASAAWELYCRPRTADGRA